MCSHRCICLHSCQLSQLQHTALPLIQVSSYQPFISLKIYCSAALRLLFCCKFRKVGVRLVFTQWEEGLAKVVAIYISSQRRGLGSNQYCLCCFRAHCFEVSLFRAQSDKLIQLLFLCPCDWQSEWVHCFEVSLFRAQSGKLLQLFFL